MPSDDTEFGGVPSTVRFRSNKDPVPCQTGGRCFLTRGWLQLDVAYVAHRESEQLRGY